MNTYAHALEEEELETALAMDEVLAGNYEPTSNRHELTLYSASPEVKPLVVKPILPKYPNGPKSGAEAEAAIREFVAQQTDEFTKRQAMEACEISSQKWMATSLVKLQREGVIEKLGTSKDARYKLCS